ncbi:MAG: hypothetical protein ABSH48_20420 [Verrucomicrobiota bacterium]|jgi:hypothetical protein
MKNRNLILAACLIFLTAAWICALAGFPGNLPIVNGCLAVYSFFSFRRSYLFICGLIATPVCMVVLSIQNPHIWAEICISQFGLILLSASLGLLLRRRRFVLGDRL